MPTIISVAEALPPFEVRQEDAQSFARGIFSESFKDIERLLNVFHNGQIEKRYFAKEIEWFKTDHSFEEKNDIYIELAVSLGIKAIQSCLENEVFLKRKIVYKEIDAIFFISSTGIATPSIDARIMNHLPFSSHTKRLPIWGLGCAGGAAGLARAYEYCRAFPEAKVIVLSVELCSLTFQHDDRSKSNLIGTSLFGDGIACALICGDRTDISQLRKRKTSPSIISTQSSLLPDSLDVMGWNIKNQGLFVVFSRSIPHLIEEWFKPNVLEFLQQQKIDLRDIQSFIAHPGGKKVLEAYIASLSINPDLLQHSFAVLKEYGNMSSATILYVLKKQMEDPLPKGSYSLGAALGPGFSSELLLMRWE